MVIDQWQYNTGQIRQKRFDVDVRKRHGCLNWFGEVKRDYRVNIAEQAMCVGKA
jgi:hypothetical protein